MGLRIEEKSLDRFTLLELRGRVVLGDGTSGLQEKVQGLLDEGRNRIIVDMAEVHYIDSSGLATLISCSRNAHKQGGDLKLVNPSKRVRDILSITRLDSVLETFDTFDLAQASFGAAPPGQATGHRISCVTRLKLQLAHKGVQMYSLEVVCLC